MRDATSAENSNDQTNARADDVNRDVAVASRLPVVHDESTTNYTDYDEFYLSGSVVRGTLAAVFTAGIVVGVVAHWLYTKWQEPSDEQEEEELEEPTLLYHVSMPSVEQTV